MGSRHLQAVAGDPYGSHQPPLSRLHRSLQDAAGAEGGVPLDGIREVVELPQVYAVYAQTVQRAL